MSKKGSSPQRKQPRAHWAPKPGPKPPGDGEGRNKAKKSGVLDPSRKGDGRSAPPSKKLTDKSRDGIPSPLAIPPQPPSSGGSGPPSGGPPSSTSSKVVSGPKSPKIKFFIGVNPKDLLCLEYGAGRNWNVKTSRTTAWNGHSISAMSRDAAVLDILVKESRGKKTLRVLDWFGSPRNLKFQKSIHGCMIDWVCAPDVAIQGDSARTVKDVRRNLVEDESFDLVIIQDVYQHGSRPTDGLGPQGVKDILGCAGAQHCYFIGRMFSGVAGADDYGNGKEEMVWYRQGGLIVASPEPQGQWYAPHPDVNWMLNRSHDGIDSSELGKYGPYTVFRLAASKLGAQTLVSQQPPPGNVVEMTLPQPGWIGSFRKWLDSVLIHIGVSDTWWCRQFFLQRRYLVNLNVYASLAPKFSLKIPNGQILDAAKHSVQESLARDFQMRCVLTRFPGVFMEIVEGTTVAVLYGQRVSNVATGLLFRTGHADVEAALIKMRGSSIESVGLRTSQVMFGVLGVVAMSVVSKTTLSVFRQFAGEFRVCMESLVPRGLGSMVPDEKQVLSLDDMSALQWSEARTGLARFYSVTALVEELIGWKLPNVKVVYACYEFFVNAQVEGGYSGRWLPLAMHLVNSVLVRKWGKKGLSVAIGLHVLNNCVATWWSFRTFNHANNPFYVGGVGTMGGWRVWPFREKDAWQEFRAAYRRGDLVEATKGVSAPIPPGSDLPPYQSKLERVDWPLRGEIKILVDGLVRQPDEALQLLSEEGAKNVVYPILVTNRLLWAPANTAKNLLVALLTRTHRDPFVGRSDEEERHKRWRGVATSMIDAGVFVGNEHRQYTIEESAALMGSRGNRILAAHQIDLKQGPTNLKKSASLKWNETITARKDFGSVMTMKPRPIVNLDPIYHARTSPDARSVVDHLHRIFDGKILTIGSISVRIHFASGYDQGQLSLMSADFFTEVACIAVSGDDSIAYVPGVGFIEGDQGMFDQSQDKGPIEIFGPLWMKQAGLPDEFICLVMECCTRKYMVRKKRLEVKGKPGTQMPTGITMTTAINSVDCIAMYVYYLLQREERVLSLEQAGWELGFTVKSKITEDFGDLTFLKGWWRSEVCGSLTWLPLPSAVIKLGKILRNPIDITKTEKTVRGRKVVERKTILMATQQVAYCLARSYGLVPMDYPIFGPFLGALLRLGMDPGRSLGALEESWKPKITTITILDREEAMAAVMRRYGVSVQWIEEVELMFNQLSSLPAYVEHSLFDSLCEVDY